MQDHGALGQEDPMVVLLKGWLAAVTLLAELWMGAGCGTDGHTFRGLALFLLPGGRPLRLGGVSGTAAAAGAGAGSGAGSTGAGAGSAGSAGAGSAGAGSGTASTFSSNRKGNAGAAGVYHIAVHVGELEAQIAQSNRAV